MTPIQSSLQRGGAGQGGTLLRVGLVCLALLGIDVTECTPYEPPPVPREVPSGFPERMVWATDPDRCVQACVREGLPYSQCRLFCLAGLEQEKPGSHEEGPPRRPSERGPTEDTDRCVEACVRRGIPHGQCRDSCLDGLPGEKPSQAAQPPGEPLLTRVGITSGTFRCPSCKRLHRWWISNRVLYWDNAPYVPVAGFRTNLKGLPNFTDVNIWVDGDFRGKGLTELQYFQQLDTLTRDITDRGGTYILLVAYPGLTNQEAARLMDPAEVSRITQKWKQMAPFVSKEGLRALLLYNEINGEWRWDEKHRPEDYGRTLGGLARQAQAIFGEVPVLFKSFGTGGGFRNVLFAAAYSSGLGMDVFPRTCSESTFDPVWENHLTTLVGSIRGAGQGLLWATEWGKGAWQDAPPGQYWKAFPPFAAKEELQCVVSRLIRAGFTGFIYNGPDKPEYDQSYRWYGELHQQVVRETVARAEGSGRLPASGPREPTQP